MCCYLTDNLIFKPIQRNLFLGLNIFAISLYNFQNDNGTFLAALKIPKETYNVNAIQHAMKANQMPKGKSLCYCVHLYSLQLESVSQ